MSEHAGAKVGKSESRLEGHQLLAAVPQVDTRGHHVTAKK